MRYPLSILAAAVIVAAAAGSSTAGSIKDCDKIQAADAYNRCLASFGPVAHEHELKPVPPGIGSGRLYGLHLRHHHGRKSMELSVAPSQGAQD